MAEFIWNLIIRSIGAILSGLIPYIPYLLLLGVVAFLIQLVQYKNYKNSAYYQITKASFFSLRSDKGRYGEYLIYKKLKSFEKHGAKFLFNVYIPKEDGETSEIDVLMLASKGIFVFESKNYSGWIFGSEHQQNWYQTLPAGRGKSHKEHFFNPILQNRGHIKHLSAFLDVQMSMHSIIVFSERCTLKNVQIKSRDIRVIQRGDIAMAVSEVMEQCHEAVYSADEIETVYEKLYPLTQVDSSVKDEHVARIRANLDEKAEQPTVEEINADQTELPKEETFDEATPEDVVEPIKIQVPKCPRCNGDLILKTATKGENKGNKFYGCSNFPKCRYIQNE